MSTTLNIVISLVMLVFVFWAIFKKLNAIYAFMIASLVGIIYYTIANGSITGGTTGSAFLDMFDYLKSIWSVQMADQILMLMSVMGYVAYMNHIKATNLLCLLLGKPLKKMNKPYIVLFATMVFTAILKWAIQSNAGQAALIIATLFPIILSLGITKETATSALVFATAIIWGPGNGLTVMLWGMAPSELPIADYFAKYELINVAICMAVSFTVFYFTSKYYDKKEGAQPVSEWDEVQDPKELGIPYFYAALPFLPVVLILVFSSLVVKTIIIPIATANILSYFFVSFLELIRCKDKKAAFESTAEFWKGCSDMMLITGGLLVAANVFSGVLSKVGGIAQLFSLAIPQASSDNVVVVIIVGAALAFVFTIVANVVGMTSLFGAVLGNIMASMGVSMHILAKTLLPAGTISAALSPVGPGNLYLAKATGIDVMTLVKRCILPAVSYWITAVIVTQFVLVG